MAVVQGQDDPRLTEEPCRFEHEPYMGKGRVGGVLTHWPGHSEGRPAVYLGSLSFQPAQLRGPSSCSDACIDFLKEIEESVSVTFFIGQPLKFY